MLNTDGCSAGRVCRLDALVIIECIGDSASPVPPPQLQTIPSSTRFLPDLAIDPRWLFQWSCIHLRCDLVALLRSPAMTIHLFFGRLVQFTWPRHPFFKPTLSAVLRPAASSSNPSAAIISVDSVYSYQTSFGLASGQVLCRSQRTLLPSSVNPRYRICRTNVWWKILSIKAENT
jgi:hypothetical protein